MSVIKCEPFEGMVEAYDQVQIKFIFETTITGKILIQIILLKNAIKTNL